MAVTLKGLPRLIIVNRHVQTLLETPIGRDFNLITASNVQFKVHSLLFIGGSKVFQEGLFPNGVSDVISHTREND